jgi:hypothetical protein
MRYAQTLRRIQCVIEILYFMAKCGKTFVYIMIFRQTENLVLVVIWRKLSAKVRAGCGRGVDLRLFPCANYLFGSTRCRMPAHTRFRTWSLFSSNVVSLGCHRDIYLRVDIFCMVYFGNLMLCGHAANFRV